MTHQTTPADRDAIAALHQQAFGPTEGPEIADLARVLLGQPDTITITVRRDGEIAGNVLFTPFAFCDHPQVSCQLLAPCAVAPQVQGRGLGRALMQTSIAHLTSLGVDAVFVLGIPDFYPRYGFAPTDLQTPYPDLLTMPQAWMALELTPGTLDRLSGPTLAVDAFMQPELWDTSLHA
jgi:predicted N-acetyltransferase YhbS